MKHITDRKNSHNRMSSLKKSKLMKMFAYVLVVVMLMTTFMSTSVVSFSKNQFSTYETDMDEGMPAGPDDGLDDGGDDEDDDDYSLSASVRRISFGTVRKDTGDTEYQAVTLTNTGSTSIELMYYVSDAERVFLCDSPDDFYLAPGQSTNFYFAMQTDYVDSGKYYAEFMAASTSDPDFENGVFVDITGTIADNSPKVTKVTIRPGSVQMATGASYQFGVDVTGENNPDTSVNWSLNENKSPRTTLSNDGYLYIADDESSDLIVVTAESVINPGIKDVSYVTVKGGTYTVTTRSNPSEGGNTGGGGTVTKGSDASVLASSNNGYTFVNWTIDGREVSTSPKYVLTNIRQNYDLVANFRPTNCYVKVKVNHPEGGTVTDSANVPYNGSITLNANPKSGFSFEGWYEDGKKFSTSNSVYLSGITKNREITANFVQEIFNVTVRTYPDGAGSVSGNGNYKKGANVSISARPIDGYEFVNWTCNNNEITKSLDFTLTGLERDCVLVANFQKKKIVTYEISAVVASGRGTISPQGVTKIQQNGNIMYTISPASGYVISAVAVDGVQKGSVSTFSFKNVTSNHSIAVAFEPVKSPQNSTNPSGNNQSNNGNNQGNNSNGNNPLKPNVPNIEPSDTSGANSNNASGANSNSNENNATSSGNNTTGTDNNGNGNNDAEIPSATPEFDQPGNIEPEAIGNPDVPYDLDKMTGVLQRVNITPSEARELIKNGNDQMLLEMASEEQYLGVTVHNEFANTFKETESTSYANVTSVPNMQDVVGSILSIDEKLYVLEGNNIKINLSIFDTTGLDTPDTKEIEKYAKANKLNVGKNFEVILMKTIEGNSKIINNTEVPAKIVINVPKELKDSERKFGIIRSHKEADGTISLAYLEDEDSNPDTITFSTGKFSSYAIGYVGGLAQNDTKTLVITGLIVILVVAVFLTIAIGIVLSNRRKRRHKKYMKRS